MRQVLAQLIIRDVAAMQGFSDAGKKARFEQWEKLGLDRVKADLPGERSPTDRPRASELADATAHPIWRERRRIG